MDSGPWDNQFYFLGLGFLIHKITGARGDFEILEQGGLRPRSESSEMVMWSGQVLATCSRRQRRESSGNLAGEGGRVLGQGRVCSSECAPWVEPLGISSSAGPSHLAVPKTASSGEEGAGQGRGWQWV